MEFIYNYSLGWLFDINNYFHGTHIQNGFIGGICYILEKVFSFVGLVVNVFHNLLLLVVYSCFFILAIIFIISIFE